MLQKSWIEESFFRRECVKFISSSQDLHRCVPVCQVCQSLIRCYCGRLIGEHSWEGSFPPISLHPCPGQDEEHWSTEHHTKLSPTNAYGTIDFHDSATRACRAKYVRVAVDSKPDMLLQLMLREWQMERPKLLLTVHGGSENFTLPPKVKQAFSKGLVTAALSTGAWILTDGINTGVSKYVGEAVKVFGGHNLRKRNTIGLTPWGVIDNSKDLIGRDVFRPYQPLRQPLSKRASLNGFHSHFLLVDDGTLGKHGCQHDVRRKLEKHIQLQKIHPRLNQGVPAVCVVVEGGPTIVSTVLEYVSSVPPVPVFVFEGSGRAADLLAFLYKQTAVNRQLDADIKDDFLIRIGNVFSVERTEASRLYTLLLQCMDHRQSITIFDSESEEQLGPDAAILTTSLKGTNASPAEKLSIALAWDRADIAQKEVLLHRQNWQAGSLEQAMLDALVMDRVSFVKLLIDNGMTMSRFLTVGRLEELYNTPWGQTHNFLHHLVEDVKQTSLPVGYRLSLIDMGLVIEYLIGGAYRSTYTRKHFRTAYSRLQDKSLSFLNFELRGMELHSKRARNPMDQHFFRTAQPYKLQEQNVSPRKQQEKTITPGLGDAPLLVPFNCNDLFVWAVLQQRQQMALFLWQYGKEALARATVACKLYRSMALEARQSSMDDNIADRFKAYSLEFGQLAVDVLDCAFRQNEKMAMKLLTSEMEAWSHFTCLQMAVSSGHRPFVSHSCTQTLLTDLWTGPLNMRKNSFLKIILSLLLPPAVLLLEFKSQAEMCHVPQSHEASLFGRDSQTPGCHHAECGSSFYERSHRAVPQNITLVMVQSLSWITRLYEFYTAPVVKFWFHTMSYLAFLMLFSYTVLVKMEAQPSVQESIVIVYILSTAVEKMREVLMSEPRKLSQKLKIWFSEYWNISDFIAILLFLSGLVMRLHADPYRTAGRICYCLDIIFWFVRVLDLLAVNQHAGPYLTMITKMTSNMFFIVVMMAIVLLSFGLSRKAILSPDEEPSWTLARDVVFQPYWMIFGEVYAGEIDACDDGQPCPPGFFLTAFLQAVYMFFQYIIMVNILIAFFNNIYFDMASKSNKLWKYNRYRYIMTYQERPWLPPPIIMLCHMALSLRAVYRNISGDTEHEERGSGLKLHLANDDRKKLHEFEEKCVQIYFHEKNEGLHSTQTNRIRATAERAEEMCGIVEEVSERVSFIQESLSGLDNQLGELQDLLALTVDTLCLLNASDSLHKEAHLAKCQPSTASRHVAPHSWTLPYGAGVEGDLINMQRLAAKLCKSTPPSLLRGYNPSRRASQECQMGARGSRGGRRRNPEIEDENKHEEPHSAAVQHAGGFRALTPYNSCGCSCCLIPPSRLHGKGFESPHQNLLTCEANLYLSQENASMEEEEEDQEEEEQQEAHEVLSNLQVSRSTSSMTLLFHRQDSPEGLVNPAFSLDDNQPSLQSRCSRKREKDTTSSSRVCLTRDRGYRGYCRSLSSSMENMTMTGAPRSPLRGSFPSLNELESVDSLSFGQNFSDDTSLRCIGNREWSKSSDFPQLDSRGRCQKNKTVKIQEKTPVSESLQSRLSDTSWKRHKRFRGEAACWSASTSLSQLNLEPTDLLQKQMFTHHDFWAKSMSCRSSLQSTIGTEVKNSSFQSVDNLYPHYSAVERNNLMRLAQTIPFTPVSILGGEEVSVYCLEEIPESSCSPSTVSSWSSRGLSALLQPLSSEEGSLDGGLRQGCRVLCTWAEQEVLRPGLVYIVKAFRPEVVCAWQRYFHGSTTLQLCLREIQQQRAAQKLMQVFNQLKPGELHHSPRFLDVLLILWNLKGQWLTIERNMSGDFRKFNNNTGEEITPCCSLEEMLLAFSHWTYEYSHKELLVLDMQGVADELTDPTVIMADNQSGGQGEMYFGPDNLGDAAISGFLLKHTCNSCCHRLGLSDLRRRPDNCESGSEGEPTPRKEEQEDNETGM